MNQFERESFSKENSHKFAKELLNEILNSGAQNAKIVASETLARATKALGLK